MRRERGVVTREQVFGTLKNNMPSALSTPVNSVRVGVYEVAWQSQDAKCISCSVNQEEKKNISLSFLTEATIEQKKLLVRNACIHQEISKVGPWRRNRFFC